MRHLLTAGILLASTLASADQFLSIPTGAKVPFGDVKLDYATGIGSAFSRAYADFGISPAFETTLRFERPEDLNSVGTFDFAYNYISPISGISPGVSVGVQDGLDRTPEGRRFYIAMTTREIYTTESGDSPGEVTIGAFGGKRSSPFVGLSLPLSNYMRLVACHDGFSITAGVEFRKTKNFGIRFVTVDGRPQVGIQTLTRF